MREVSQRFPDDPDIGTLFADAMMNMRPWHLWTEDGKPSLVPRKSSRPSSGC